MDDLDFFLERTILKIGNQLLTRRSEDLRHFDLTPNQSETLLFFGANGGAMIQALGRHLKISHQAARSLVERMREKGLLEVAVSESDARARTVRLSAHGAAVCRALREKGSDLGGDLLRTLSPPEKQQLAALLKKIAGNL